MTGGPVDRNDLVEVVGPVWSEARAIAALDVSAGTASSMRDAGSLLGLRTSDGARVYPVAQFQRRDGTVEVKPALVPVLRALRGSDPWAVAVLLHTPAPELDGATPLGWLSDGGSPETLARLARMVAREWAAGTVRQASTGGSSSVGDDPASGLPAVAVGRPVSAAEVSEALDDD